MRSSSGRSLVIYSTSLLSVVAGHLKLSERKITCLNLEKCNLLLTPPAEIAWETYGSVMHHLLSPLFHPSVQNFRKTDSFASEHSSLGKPNNIGFSLKGYILITVYNFGVSEQHSRVGKDRARPTQVFHCLGVVRMFMAMGVYDLEM